MEYKRILLKLSGEALGTKDEVIDKDVLQNLTEQIKILQNEFSVQIGIVVGGGNIFRGQISNSLGLGEDTSSADYMGMMATSINALGIKTYLENNGVQTVMQNALFFEDIAPKVDKDEAIKALESNKVVVFGGGTGKPYCSTDTAAAMRAIDIKADVILMAKSGVDGVYTSDPNIDKDAKFISSITYDEIIEAKLKVADETAMKLLKGENIDMIVFNMNTRNNIINLYRETNNKKTIIKE